MPLPIFGAVTRNVSPVGTVTRDGGTARIPKPTSSRSEVSPPVTCAGCPCEETVWASAAMNETNANRERDFFIMIRKGTIPKCGWSGTQSKADELGRMRLLDAPVVPPVTAQPSATFSANCDGGFRKPALQLGEREWRWGVTVPVRPFQGRRRRGSIDQLLLVRRRANDGTASALCSTRMARVSARRIARFLAGTKSSCPARWSQP